MDEYEKLEIEDDDFDDFEDYELDDENYYDED